MDLRYNFYFACGIEIFYLFLINDFNLNCLGYE